MTPKKLKTKVVEKNDYRVYLNKANDFYEIMFKARDAGRIRSIGEDHMQVADLLTRVPLSGINNEVTILKRIIAKKNVIAYENREFRQAEALDILKLAERFYNWVLLSFPI